MRYAIMSLILLISCQPEEECKKCEYTNCFDMINISDALPVQFWLNGQPSFNEKIEQGIEHHCFNQKFNADDPIKTQLYEDDASEFILSTPNLWTNLAPYGIQTKTNTLFAGNQFSGGAVTRKAYQALSVASGSTIKFKIFTSFFTGTTSVTFTLTDGSDVDTSAPVTIVSTDPGANGVHEIELTATSASARLRITVDMSAGANRWSAILIPSVKSYRLRIEDEDSAEITTLDFTRTPAETTQSSNTAALAAASTSNANGGVTNWAGGTVNLVFGGAGTKKSYLKYVPINVEGQRIRIFIEANGSKTGSVDLTQFTVALLDNAFSELAAFTFDVPAALWSVTGYIELDATGLGDVAHIGLYSYSEASASGTATTFLDAMTATYNMYPETAVFQNTLIPEDESITSQFIKLVIIDENGETVAYSDYLDIKPTHKRTNLLQYSDKKDFAGLIYDGISPVPNYAIRVESKFFKTRNPEENESENLSDGSVVKLLGTAKKQKLIQVEPAPPYIHTKLTFILQHNTIYIDNQAWIKEEAYETEDLDEYSAMSIGKAWLTQKNNSYVTNPFS